MQSVQPWQSYNYPAQRHLHLASYSNMKNVKWSYLHCLRPPCDWNIFLQNYGFWSLQAMLSWHTHLNNKKIRSLYILNYLYLLHQYFVEGKIGQQCICTTNGKKINITEIAAWKPSPISKNDARPLVFFFRKKKDYLGSSRQFSSRFLGRYKPLYWSDDQFCVRWVKI